MKKRVIASLLTISTLMLMVSPYFASATPQSDHKSKVAIFPFANTNKEAVEADYGQAVSGMLTTEIINGREFQVVERAQIDKIMSELSFQISGAVDSETAKRIGQVFGVDMLVFGNVAKFGNLIETDIRLVDTESGQALAAENANARNESEIRPMVIALSRKIEQRYRERFLVSVELNSSPGGANAFVDNSLVGKTPVVARLSPGQHHVRLELADYQPWTQDFIVQDGVSKLAADLLRVPSLATTPPSTSESQTQTTKSVDASAKKRHTRPLLIIGGVMALGGLIGTVLALSGGDDGNESGSVSIIIDNIP